MNLPTLYKKTSTGKIQQWTVSVLGNTIRTEYGQVGGKLQVTTETIDHGKNIGRSNETSPEQQAEAEAKSRHERKLKKDYVLTPGEARDGGSSDLIEGGVLPMLAHRYDKHGDKIKFPCYVQPKLDGHRCIAVVDDTGKCTLWSRTRKPILSMPHIVAAVEETKIKGIVLDGELYNHDYRDKFEELTSLIRPAYAKDGHEVVQYHVYDIVPPNMPLGFGNRDTWLETWQYEHFIYSGYSGPLRLVETEPVGDAAQVKGMFNKYVAKGYEGAILRNVLGAYKNGRSYDLQKVKSMQDAEFTIVGVKEGRGKLKGHGIFECKTDMDVRFDVKMAGELEGLKKYYENPREYIGRKLTVQFQDWTAAAIPRFPVGLRFRKDL
jgi:DNA ligase-1